VLTGWGDGQADVRSGAPQTPGPPVNHRSTAREGTATLTCNLDKASATMAGSSRLLGKSFTVDQALAWRQVPLPFEKSAANTQSGTFKRWGKPDAGPAFRLRAVVSLVTVLLPDGAASPMGWTRLGRRPFVGNPWKPGDPLLFEPAQPGADALEGGCWPFPAPTPSGSPPGLSRWSGAPWPAG